MAETFGSIIDYVDNQLQGFTTDSPMYASTTTLMQAGSLSVGLDVPAQSQPQGVIEIGGELLQVDSWSSDGSTATIYPWGRGVQGTTAAAHPIGSKVIVNPRYPRHRIGQVINQVIAGMCPPLFAVQTGTFTAEPLTYEYALPASTRNLLRVESRATAAYDWCRVRSATVKRDSGAPTLHVNGDVYATQEIRYTVAANPTPFTSESQAFTTCGLPESVIDIVSLGAIPRLVTTTDLARQQLNSVEVSERAVLIPSGSAPATARFYMQMYQDRLAAEAKRLRQEYPLTLMRNS